MEYKKTFVYIAERPKKNVFRDNSGNGCETNADYVGAHIGIGKEISPINSGTHSSLCFVITFTKRGNILYNMKKVGMRGVFVIRIEDDFDLEKIADSGQCFRWQRDGDGFRIPFRDSLLFIRKVGPQDYEVDCTEEEFDSIWRPYFDLVRSYRAIRGKIKKKDDPVLFEAAKLGQGIRILKQDPWEMLITFIISQRKNIPAIRQAVEAVCRAAGKKKTANDGTEWYMFPSAEEIASLSDEALASCRLGYRDKYVRAAAEAALRGEIDFRKLSALSHEDCLVELQKLYGVGIKVAQCVSLFGLHHLDAFPRDVWILRVLDEVYDGGKNYRFDAYAPYNGVMQQYLFEYYRNKDAREVSV